ncbi:uncharacterized protein [Montipora capricornis]|uniref:uncharacterized protein n=1 Tax=Montipora capricornis TaxID=246305 RepID=UPI0035F1F9C3
MAVGTHKEQLASAVKRGRKRLDLAVEAHEPFHPGLTSTPSKAGNVPVLQSPVVLQDTSVVDEVDITGSVITTVGDSSFVVENGEVSILESDHDSDHDSDSDSASDDSSDASFTLNYLSGLRDLDEDQDMSESSTDSGDDMYYREEESGDEMIELGSLVETRSKQGEPTASVSTQTDASDLSSSAEITNIEHVAPLQPVPYVKNALRASKFNRLEEQAQLKKEITLVVGTKVMCSLDLLLQLFAEKCRHPQCLLATTVSHTICGTSVLIKWKRQAGHEGKFWSSHKVNGVLANNLQACAAILLSGNNFSQVERLAKFLGWSFVSRSTFCRAQRLYCIPAINEWWTWQQTIINQELQGQNVVVMGDGQCDSPGFTAKNLCYFLMEMTTGYIIDLEVLDKREVELKSVNMEKKALEIILQRIKHVLKVVEVVTDASASIKKMMGSLFQDIFHSLDVWHKAKSIRKCINKTGSSKDLQKISQWSDHIINHFWYCCETAAKETNSDDEALSKMKVHVFLNEV